MSTGTPRGTVYTCPVCGAQVSVLAHRHGVFAPRCCNVNMRPQTRRLVFYVCKTCGSEVAILNERSAGFQPRCCNSKMAREAA